MHQPITMHHIMAQHFQNQRLSEFVMHGLRDFGRGTARGIELLLGQLAQEQLSELDNVARFSSPAPRSRKLATGAELVPTPDEFVFTRYASFIANNAINAVARVVPVRLPHVSEAQYVAILSATGHLVTTVDVPHETALPKPGSDPVVTAWNKARENEERALQRAGAVLYLASQMPTSVFGRAKAAVESEVNQALSVLFRMAATFRTTELEFAVILGGEALAQSRKRVLDDYLHAGASLIQYLHTDQYAPSQYASETSDNFRAALKAYANQARGTVTS